MIRLAVLSFWHSHAPDYVQEALANPATTITAVWDEIPERGRAQAQALGVPFYHDLHDLLSQAAVDGVIVTVPTTLHRDVIVAAAQAGKHIFTEKVLAPTLRESQEIMAAVDQAGVVLMVGLPGLSYGVTFAIKAILDQQLLGELTLVRTRVAHGGALRTRQHPEGWLPPYFFDPRQTGGGTMIDDGAHAMYLMRLFLDLPESVSASYGFLTGRAVEDNAVVVLRYAQGALGLVESSFVNPFSPSSEVHTIVEVHGTQGSLLYAAFAQDGALKGTLLIRSVRAGLPTGNQWSAWIDIPPDQPAPFEQWVSHIQQGTTATENIQAALDLSLLMEAANRSAQSNRPVRLEEIPSR